MHYNRTIISSGGMKYHIRHIPGNRELPTFNYSGQTRVAYK